MASSSRFFSLSLGYNAESAFAKRRKSGPRSCSALTKALNPFVRPLACKSIAASTRSSVVASRFVQWVSEALSRGIGGRDERWSEAIAVGDFTFVHKVKSELGFKAIQPRVMEVTGTYTLREESEPYNASFTAEIKALSPENTLLRDENAEIT
jgi:hypothetical protein